MSPLADLPDGPCWAVIFASVRAGANDGYEPVADAILALARRQPGFLGAEGARDADGVGITVSYWESLEAIDAWRHHPDHVAAKDRAREWYAGYRIRICRVEGPHGH